MWFCSFGRSPLGMALEKGGSQAGRPRATWRPLCNTSSALAKRNPATTGEEHELEAGRVHSAVGEGHLIGGVCSASCGRAAPLGLLQGPPGAVLTGRCTQPDQQPRVMGIRKMKDGPGQCQSPCRRDGRTDSRGMGGPIGDERKRARVCSC